MTQHGISAQDAQTDQSLLPGQERTPSEQEGTPSEQEGTHEIDEDKQYSGAGVRNFLLKVSLNVIMP